MGPPGRGLLTAVAPCRGAILPPSRQGASTRRLALRSCLAAYAALVGYRLAGTVWNYEFDTSRTYGNGTAAGDSTSVSMSIPKGGYTHYVRLWTDC